MKETENGGGKKLDKVTGNYYGCRDCPIESDWLLIYKYDEDTVFLIRTGTHLDLFKKKDWQPVHEIYQKETFRVSICQVKFVI